MASYELEDGEALGLLNRVKFEDWGDPITELIPGAIRIDPPGKRDVTKWKQYDINSAADFLEAWARALRNG